MLAKLDIDSRAIPHLQEHLIFSWGLPHRFSQVKSYNIESFTVNTSMILRTDFCPNGTVHTSSQ